MAASYFRDLYTGLPWDSSNVDYLKHEKIKAPVFCELSPKLFKNATSRRPWVRTGSTDNFSSTKILARIFVYNSL